MQAKRVTMHTLRHTAVPCAFKGAELHQMQHSASGVRTAP
jgi:hypothetical protein